MMGLLATPFAKRASALLVLAAILAAYGWHMDRSGYNRAAAEYEAALAAAASQTMEAIQNAPAYTTDDPDALRMLCAIAGITDCPLRRDTQSTD